MYNNQKLLTGSRLHQKLQCKVPSEQGGAQTEGLLNICGKGNCANCRRWLQQEGERTQFEGHDTLCRPFRWDNVCAQSILGILAGLMAAYADAGMQDIQGWNTFRSTIYFCMHGSEVHTLAWYIIFCTKGCVHAISSAEQTRCIRLVVLCRFLPCCHPHTSIRSTCSHGCHLYSHLLLFWSVVVGYTTVRHCCLC